MIGMLQGGAGCPCCPPWLADAGARRRPAPRTRKASHPVRAGKAHSLRAIDVHHHHLPPGYLAAGPKYDSPGNAGRQWTPGMSIEDMDRGGVETAITSMSSPNVWWGEPALRARLARECNEYAARMMADFPGRFGMFASLPMPDVRASLAEIEYSLDTLKADGVVFLTSLDGKYLGDELFAPVLEELNRRGAVVYTHPTVPMNSANLLAGVPAAVVEFGTETTRTIASLVFSGASIRYPRIRFIFSHAGGTLPFLVERFTRLARRKDYAERLPRGVLPEFRRFFYEVAQAANPMALASLRQLVATSQVLFGTDFPYRAARDIAHGLKGSGFSAAELRAVQRGNALKLFPKFAGGTRA